MPWFPRHINDLDYIGKSRLSSECIEEDKAHSKNKAKIHSFYKVIFTFLGSRISGEKKIYVITYK